MKLFAAFFLACLLSVAAFGQVPSVFDLSSGTPANGSTTLSAKVLTNGSATNVVIRYGFGATLDQSIRTSISNSADVQTVARTITPLVGGKTYRFTVEATNNDGTSGEVAGPDFVVPAYAPTIALQPVQTSAGGKATLRAKITANGRDVTSITFGYGRGNTSTPATPVPNTLPADAVAADVIVDLAGLERGAVYRYKFTAQNPDETNTDDTLTFTATPNRPPITGADAFIVRNTDPVLIDVLKNDRDPEGDSFSIIAVTGATQGTVEIVGNQLRYTPRNSSIGPDTIIYTVRDSYLDAPGISTGVLTVRSPSLTAQGMQAVPIVDAEGNEMGLLRLVGNAGGAVTGKLEFYDQTYTVAGVLDEFGRFRAVIPRAENGPLEVQVAFDQSTDVSTVQARILADGNEFSGSQPVGVFSKERRAELVGTYTLQIPSPGSSDATLPGGTGYMVLQVREWGAVNYQGKLGDGTKFSGSTVLSGDDSAPTATYWITPGNSRVGGVVNFSADFRAELSSNVRWYRAPDNDADFFPDGFYIESSATGSYYEKPEEGRRALSPYAGSDNKVSLVLRDGNLGANITHNYDITKNDKLTLLDPTGDGITLKIDRSAGTFKGEFDHPLDGSRRKFQGVLLQNDQVGRGVFIGLDQTGTVEFRFGQRVPTTPTPTPTPTNPGAGGNGNGGFNNGAGNFGGINLNRTGR